MQPLEIGALVASLAALSYSAWAFFRGVEAERAVARMRYERVMRERLPLLAEYARLGLHDDAVELYSETLQELSAVRAELRQRYSA